jgi:putative phosphoesterase
LTKALDYLRGLEPHVVVAAGNRVAVVVHGSPYSDMDYILRHSHPPAVLRSLLRATRADVLVCGHTHEPMWYRCELGIVVNPGSTLSMPVARSSRTFALIDGEAMSVSFHEVESGRAIEIEPWAD